MLSRRFWIGAALFWFAFGVIEGIQTWLGMLEHHHFVPLLLGHFVVVWEAWVLFTAVISRLVHRFPVVPPGVRNIVVHVIAACAIGATHAAYWMTLTVVMRPYDRLNATWSDVNIFQSVIYRLPAEFVIYAAVTAAMQAVDHYGRAAQLQASLTNARLHALELQIQPHFLFNTLNAVSSLVRTNRNDEAVTMVAGLSDILRYTLDHEGSQRVSLEAETDMLRRYLEIQRARFADRMTVSIDVDPSTRTAAIPTLILQPLAENAVRHGIARSSAGGVVAVKTFRENGWLRVDVTNTGSLQPADREGIGLRNTRERLRQLYGDNQMFELREERDSVVASLRVPWSEMA